MVLGAHTVTIKFGPIIENARMKSAPKDIDALKNEDSIIPVIMAGGSGTRLWPLSREQFPKQFVHLLNDSSLLQATLLRLGGLQTAKPIVICNEDHRFLAADQMNEIGFLDHNIILEPMGRNTAATAALAALLAIDNDEDPILLILAADHEISQPEIFHEAVLRALPYAKDGKLVTFGITPRSPETGYGYIRQDKTLSEGVHRVAAFVEKPKLALAKEYLAEGNYLWNSGMFLFKASTYISELGAYRPDILNACIASIESTQTDMDFIRINQEAFKNCPSESIDCAVMENTDHAVVVALDAGWSDIGAFDALWALLPHDSQGNASRGDVINIDTKNTLVLAENALVATIGLSDLVVIQTDDAILISDRSRTQEVKDIVNTLKSTNRREFKFHKQVHRPWGNYVGMDEGERFQVKRITVKPGEKLSMQMHHHRAEHWIVVSGTASVTLGDQVSLLTENQSIYLPVGAVHSLENPGRIMLELIEVQVGSYLGEDDIVRFEDRYGRV
jgi:mannose-1-phosphate guanylyltransferase